MDSSPNPSQPRLIPSRIIPWVLGIGSVILFFLFRTPDILPGISTKLMNLVLGLSATPLTTVRIYSFLTGLITKVLPFSPLTEFSLFSALCAGFCVMAVYHLMRQLKFTPPPNHGEHRPDSSTDLRASQLAALTAALCLVVTPTFWNAATSPSNATFDLAILLGALLLLLKGSKSANGLPYFIGSVFLWGLGITQYAGMIGAAPLFGITLLILLLRSGLLETKTIALLLLAGFLGLLFYLLAPLELMDSPAYKLAGEKGYFELIVDTWKRQYHDLRRGMPNAGGLLIFLTCYAPWIYILMVSRISVTGLKFSRFMVHLTLFFLPILGIALLLGVTYTPARLLGRNTTLLPYLSIITWMGYLAGFWYSHSMVKQTHSKAPGYLRAIGIATSFLILLSPIGIFAAGFTQTYQPKKAPLTGYIRDMLGCIGDQKVLYLSTPGTIDLATYISGTEGMGLTIVSQKALREPLYRASLQVQHPGDHDLASLNPNNQPELIQSVIKACGGPELFAFSHALSVTLSGYIYLPQGLTVLARESYEGIDTTQLAELNRRLFDQFQVPELNDPAAKFLCREYSRAANDTGTAFMLLKDTKEAENFYLRAIEIYPENPSALLNLGEWYTAQQKKADPGSDTAQKHQEGATDMLNKAYEAAQESGLSNPSPQHVAAWFGHLYSAGTALIEAQQYRSAGLFDAASAAIKRAELANPNNLMVKQNLVLQGMGAGSQEASISEFKRLISENPHEITNYIILSGIYGDNKEYSKGLELLQSVPDNLKENPQRLSLMALFYAKSGNEETGNELLLKVHTTRPTELQTQSFLAAAAFELGNTGLASTYAEAAISQYAQQPEMLRILIQIAGNKQGNINHERLIELFSRTAGSNQALKEEALTMAMLAEYQNLGRNIANDLIDLHPENYTAHFALGTLEDAEEHFDIAEQHYRVCLQHTEKPTYDVILNNLAYALFRQDRGKEGVEYARLAVERNVSRDSYHHTLAATLLQANQTAEAEKSILKALTLNPDNAYHKVLYAEILATLSKNQQAKDLAASVVSQLDGSWRDRAKTIVNTP